MNIVAHDKLLVTFFVCKFLWIKASGKLIIRIVWFVEDIASEE